MKFSAWRTYGAAILAGALSALALPPLYWLPLGVAGFVFFVRQWDTAPTPRDAWLRAWAWGFGHFAVGSSWMLKPFFVPPADFAWLGPPAVIGLAVVLGLFYPSLAAFAARWLVRRWPYLGGRYRRLVLLAIFWTATEWLRGHLFTGYPWNPIGHVWAFAPALLQGASVFGVYGLGTFTFAILAAPAAGWRAAFVALGVVGLAGVAGLAVMPPADAGPDGPVVRIVQPNVPQSEKWATDNRAAQFAELIELSRRPGFEKLAAVVWPETAVPFVVEPGSAALPALATAAPPGGYLLGGMARGTLDPADGVWNSMLAIDAKGAIQAHYDKVHLVPFGEYIPYHKEFPPLSGAIGRGSFERGTAFVTLSLPGLPPFSPTICYEAIFPGEVTGPGERPRWMVNVTNDAWFGSSGPYQHLTSARLRAVEEGLPMIRAANTGVSAVIDAYGRILGSLDLDRKGVMDHAIPPARVATPYAEWGDLTVLAMLALLGVFLAPKRRRRRPLQASNVTRIQRAKFACIVFLSG
jgi:apolipoprotein N-acyltransferase